MSIDDEREYAQAAVSRAGDAIEIATRMILLAQKMIRDCGLTDAERQAADDAYDWAHDRRLLPYQQVGPDATEALR